MPQVILASAGDHHCRQVDPSFSYQVGLLVIVEYGALELIVVGRIMNRES